MRAALATLLLACLAAADPLPEGAALEILGPEPGMLVPKHRARVEVRWRATGLPEGALVRLVRRAGEEPWQPVDGAQYLPVSPGRFVWELPREMTRGPTPPLSFGLVYLAPHEPRTWHVDGRSARLADVAGQVRPGDTIEVGPGERTGGVTLPGGVVVRPAPGAEAVLAIKDPGGACLTVAGVPGADAPTTVEGIRFTCTTKPEGNATTVGVRLHGGEADVTRCTFEGWLGAGIDARNATVAVRACNASTAKGAVVLLRGSIGTVEGGVFSGCGVGISVQEGSTAVVSQVTIDGGETGDGVWAMRDTRVSVTKCRIRGRTGVSSSDGAGLHAEENAIEAVDTGVNANMRMRGEAALRVLSNKISGAETGILVYGGSDSEVAGNELDGIRQYGIRVEISDASIRGNAIRMVPRGAGWAPKRWSPYWQTGAVGVLSGLSGAGRRPTIAGNTIRGYDKHPIALVWGADAVIADNTYEDKGHAVYRSKDPYEGTHQMADAAACARARATWEMSHPGSR